MSYTVIYKDKKEERELNGKYTIQNLLDDLDISSETIVPKQKDVENTNGTISTKIDGYSINVIRIYHGSNNGEDAYVLPDIPSTMCQDVTQYNTPYITLGAFIAIMVILGVSIIGFALIGILRHIYKKKQKE